MWIALKSRPEAGVGAGLVLEFEVQLVVLFPQRFKSSSLSSVSLGQRLPFSFFLLPLLTFPPLLPPFACLSPLEAHSWAGSK